MKVGMIQQSRWTNLAVAASIKLQLQNSKKESRGMTQTCTVKSEEEPQGCSHTHMVKAREFSSQIPLPQTSGREERQGR